MSTYSCQIEFRTVVTCPEKVSTKQTATMRGRACLAVEFSGMWQKWFVRFCKSTRNVPFKYEKQPFLGMKI